MSSMPDRLAFLILLLAWFSFVFATFDVKARVNLIALGLALWVLTQLF
jgi:hypothetical protein